MSERSLQDLKDHCKKRKKHRDRCLPPFCFCFAFSPGGFSPSSSTTMSADSRHAAGKRARSRLVRSFGSSQVLFAFKMAELEGTLGPEIIVKFYVLD